MGRDVGQIVRASDGGFSTVAVQAAVAAALLNMRGAATTTDIISMGVTGDATNRFVVNANGTLEWGAGAAGLDATLSRNGVNGLLIDNYFACGLDITARNGAAAQTRMGAFGPSSQAGLVFGSGNDTNLYRIAVATLAMGGGIQGAYYADSASGQYVCFRSASPNNKMGGVNAAHIPLVVIATAAQSANLTEWQDSAAVVLGSFKANGGLNLSNGLGAGAGTATGSTFYSGTGAPANGSGVNGDIYFRVDGGALTTIYQRRAGVWTGII